MNAGPGIEPGGTLVPQNFKLCAPVDNLTGFAEFLGNAQSCRTNLDEVRHSATLHPEPVAAGPATVPWQV